jgi:hypothetical protein
MESKMTTHYDKLFLQGAAPGTQGGSPVRAVRATGYTKTGKPTWRQRKSRKQAEADRRAARLMSVS